MFYKQAWKELKDYVKNKKWFPTVPYLHQKDYYVHVTLLAKMKQLEKRWKIILVKKRNMEGKRYRHPRLGIVEVIRQPGYVKGAPRNVLIRLKHGHETTVPQRSLRKIKEEI